MNIHVLLCNSHAWECISLGCGQRDRHTIIIFRVYGYFTDDQIIDMVLSRDANLELAVELDDVDDDVPIPLSGSLHNCNLAIGLLENRRPPNE